MKSRDGDISVVVVTCNEARKLAGCLESVQDIASEIVVFDLESDDDTAQVAKTNGAKFFVHKRVKFVELVRDIAVSKASCPWVLVLDPDEKVSVALSKKLQEVAKRKEADAVNIPRKNIFFGRWIAHTNFWPDYHVRFFKKGAAKWPKVVHLYPQVSGKILVLPPDENCAILHYGYDSLQNFIKRQVRYADIDAQNRYDRGEKFSLLQLIWRPLREFLARFIKHKAYLDGFYGLFLVLGLMYYRIRSEIKLLALQKI